MTSFVIYRDEPRFSQIIENLKNKGIRFLFHEDDRCEKLEYSENNLSCLLCFDKRNHYLTFVCLNEHGVQVASHEDAFPASVSNSNLFQRWVDFKSLTSDRQVFISKLENLL